MATDLFRVENKNLDKSNFMPPREIAEITVRLLQMNEKCSPSEFSAERTY